MAATTGRALDTAAHSLSLPPPLCLGVSYCGLQLELGERLGGGSSGRLYRGVYRGQDVAIKVIVLADMTGEGNSGSLRAAPASELLQMFKQEVSIM
eukprot:jgi/Mesen1/5/ME1029549C01927